jgi:hypothetical protein
MVFGGDYDGHNTKAASTDGHDFIAVCRRFVTAFAREAADGICEIPKIFEGLFLNQVEQRAIGEYFLFFDASRLCRLPFNRAGNLSTGNSRIHQENPDDNFFF